MRSEIGAVADDRQRKAGSPEAAPRRRRPQEERHEGEAEPLLPRCLTCQRVDALARERDALNRRADKLAELERLKSELFAEVSHELRTPLTLTLGPLHDLQAGVHGELPDPVREQVDLASRSAERLLGLVEQILDTARMESGRLELRVRRDDLVSVLADVAESFQPLAERRGLRFRFAPLAETIPIWCDPEQLHKVFANLLSNAMRYTPRGGRVEMTVAGTREGKVAVTVRDEGPGIAPEDRERIFDRFYRAAHATAAGHAGTGLGLPLARRLAELHGGRLTLDSAPGEGSVFRVELRLGRDHFAPGQIADGPPAPRQQGERRQGERRQGERRQGERRQGERRRKDGRAWDGPERRQGERRQSDRRIGERRMGERRMGDRRDAPDPADQTTVLVADDNPEIRAYLRRHLEPAYRVAEAGDGAAALALARELLPDLVVSDVMMPEMDGYELCRALKQDRELDWVPVVLLTARAAAADRMEGLGEGADDYVTKPFDVGELVARVDNLIASRRRLRKRFAAAGEAPRRRLPLAREVRPTPDDRQWLEGVQQAIEAKLDDDALSVGSLAADLAVDRTRLFRRLRHLTGMRPLDVIMYVRMERAAEMLKSEAVSVSEVAYAVGFKSFSHFSRRFQERFGQSPSTYQRQASWPGDSQPARAV